MKIPWRYTPLFLTTLFLAIVVFSIQQYRVCRDFLGIDEYRCVTDLLGNFGFSSFIFACFAVLTGLFLTGIRPSLSRAWLLPALIYSVFALFLIINIGPANNEERVYGSWLGMIFYFGTMVIMLGATAIARIRESKPIVAMDGIAKLLLLAPITYFVFQITVFAFANYYNNSLI